MDESVEEVIRTLEAMGGDSALIHERNKYINLIRLGQIHLEHALEKDNANNTADAVIYAEILYEYVGRAVFWMSEVARGWWNSSGKEN